MTDLILSSGYLAFAEHAGFLRGVEQAGVEVRGLCGTSSGALVGALWASGMPAERVLQRLTATAPIAELRPQLRFWRGIFSLSGMIEQLRVDLPPLIQDLPFPAAFGVVDQLGRPRLLTDGPLAEAVAASCAVPHLFQPVVVDGEPYVDGGAADRTGLGQWRALRGSNSSRRTLLHWVERSAGREVEEDLTGVMVVRSPRSKASLWSLGDVQFRYERSVERFQSRGKTL